MRDTAARLLATADGLVELSQADARKVVDYMHPRRIPAGTPVMQEGDDDVHHSMALILSGEVTVERKAEREGMVMTVLGPGSLIGELGLVDAGARSATCMAMTDMGLAILTRKALAQLIDEQPPVAARLLLLLCKRMAGYLRENNRKIATVLTMNEALQQELDATHAVNRRLLIKLDA